MVRNCGLSLLFLLLAPCWVQAGYLELNTGHVTALTDMAAKDGRIVAFRMSGDASSVVYLMDEFPEDPRGCGGDVNFGWRQSLWHLDIGNGTETLVEQGFTYDTGVGNFCATSMTQAFDISYDGRTIAWISKPDEMTLPEVNLLNLDGGGLVKVVTHVTYTSFGETNQVHIDPATGYDTLVLSGDAQVVYFVNGFGPLGTIFGQDPPPASGVSVYRVPAGGGTAEAVLTQGTLPDIAGIDPFAVAFLAAGGRLATPMDGSFVLVPVGGSYPSGVPFRNLLRCNPGAPPGNCVVLVSAPATHNPWYGGPSISADGTRMAYYYNESEDDLERDGIRVQGTTMSSGYTVVDPGIPFDGLADFLPVFPQMNADGTWLTDFMNTAGSRFYRRVNVETGAIDQVSWPMIELVHDQHAWIDNSGTRCVLQGRIKDTFDLPPGESFTYDLLLVDFEPETAPAGAPVIGSFVSEPSNVIVKEPSFHPPVIWTQRFSVSGFNAGNVYTHGTDTVYSVRRGGSGAYGYTPDFGILDDGLWEGVDEVAGDGIYTEGGIVVGTDLPGNELAVRLAATQLGGPATFVDFLMPVLDAPEARNQVFCPAGAPQDIMFPDAGVEMDFASNSNSFSTVVELLASAPVGLRRALGEHWRIVALDPSVFEVDIRFTYDELLVLASGLQESDLVLFRSESGLPPWERVPTIVDTVNNVVRPEALQGEFSYWALGVDPFEGFLIE